ncbi:MAG: S8 family serine peptidase, partial [Lewinella sp.]|nr:S8 family serine peptidase [Lewinella sp.]
WPQAVAGVDLRIDEAWTLTTGSPDIRVAVLDVGVDLLHPDLIDNLLPGYDATGQGSAGNADTLDAHGTACAGLIGAMANNGEGIAGVAYGARLLPVRVAYTPPWDEAELYLSTWIYNGMSWAWQTGQADVLSNSWGGGPPSSLMATSLANAVTQGRDGLGSVVLFAAGNENNEMVSYPAAYPEAIAVGAMNYCNERKSPTSCDGSSWGATGQGGSNYGAMLDVMAPGVHIVTTDLRGPHGYNSSDTPEVYPFNSDYAGYYSGTSAACPFAAGVAALILSANQYITAAEVRAILESTCDKVGEYDYVETEGRPHGDWHVEMGYGRINAYQAVLQAQTFVGEACVPPGDISLASVGYSHFYVSWAVDTTVDTYNVRYRQWPNGSWVNLSNYYTGRHISTIKQPCTTYEWQVQAVCDGVGGLWSEPLLIETEGCDDDYCYAYGISFDQWIEGVELADLSHASGNDWGYANFTDQMVQLTAGSTYPLTLTPGTDEESVTVYWRVWIDLDQDGDFSGTGEMVYEGIGASQSPAEASITIPPAALTGLTRIRVSMSPSGYPLPCQVTGNSDVEDYAVLIGGVQLSATPEQVSFEAAGGQAEIMVDANVAWEAATAAGWLLIDPGSGGPAGTLVIHCQGNPANVARTALVTIAGGGQTVVIMVHQAAMPPDFPWTPTAEEDAAILEIPDPFFRPLAPGYPAPAGAALLVFPNPATDQLQLEIPAGLSVLRLFDRHGRLLQTWQPVEPGTLTIALNTWPAGLYVLRGTGAGGHWHARFVRQ